MKKLQVKVNGHWEYVFCYNPLTGVSTTPFARKALLERDLGFFQRKFANHEFRVI